TATAIAAFAAGILATTLLGVLSRAKRDDDTIDSGRDLVASPQYMSPPLMGVPPTTSSGSEMPGARPPAPPPPPATTATATTSATAARRDDAVDASIARDASVAVASPLDASVSDAAVQTRDAGEDTVFDRATARALSGDLGGARSALESRFSAGTADRDEIMLLRAICRQ